ncbi:MAG: heavy metal translocating P-type ATPase, partial [Acutalibacteraceae bacterium]
FAVGELFEDIAVGKSRDSISKLCDLRPDCANLEISGEIKTVDAQSVKKDDIIIVKPGEKIPLDGIVVEGESELDTKALTGESLPRGVKAGDRAISGCVNIRGVLRIKVTGEYAESTVSKILEMVENSAENKSQSEGFITRFAKIYTPVVVLAAVAIAVIPSVVTGDWIRWLQTALVFLVVSCPCALVISVPLTYFGGIGGASRQGILVKGSNYLEALSRVKTVVFDKTGTLTEGSFEVTAVHPSDCSEYELLETAALAECYSDHPVSASLKRAFKGDINKARVKKATEISGEGISVQLDGKEVCVGNAKLMKRIGVDFHDCHRLGTVIHVALDGKYLGHIVISDKIKPNSNRAVQELKKAGVKKTVMLTGDRKEVGESVAKQLKLDEVYCELMPLDKVSKVEELLEKTQDGRLVFAGDGVNDAPVLSRADVGIAMGAIGSDAAIEAADVVIMDDDPLKIAKAIKISKGTNKIVRQNIVFAIGVKLAVMLLAALGAASMWEASFADVGVCVIAVINAMRALKIKA